MIGPALVVLAVVFHEEGGILRHRQGHTAAHPAVVAAAVDGGSGDIVSLPSLMTGLLAVRLVKVAFGGNAAHVVHGGDHGGLDPGVDGRRVQGHTTPSADTQDTDAPWVHVILNGEEINRRLKILGIDVRGSSVPGIPTALAGKGGVEGDGQEAPLSQRLGIQAGALLLHRPKGSADGHGGQPALGALRRVLVRRQSDAISVDKGDLFVVHTVTLGKGFVPLLGHTEFFRFQHVSLPPDFNIFRDNAALGRRDFPLKSLIYKVRTTLTGTPDSKLFPN